MPRNFDILVFKSKHADEYFDASTPEKRAAAFLHVLRERFNHGWYYEPQEPRVEAEQYALAAMTDEQIDALPEGAARDMRQRRERARRTVNSVTADHAREQKWYDAVAELVALPTADAITRRQGRTSLAEALADEHMDYEYEGYFDEYFTKVDEG